MSVIGRWRKAATSPTLSSSNPRALFFCSDKRVFSSPAVVFAFVLLSLVIGVFFLPRFFTALSVIFSTTEPLSQVVPPHTHDTSSVTTTSPQPHAHRASTELKAPISSASVNQARSPTVSFIVRKIEAAEPFGFAEGPAVDHEGNVYFTDQIKNEIWRWSCHSTNSNGPESLSLFLHESQRANGMIFDAHTHHLIACADEHNRLVRISTIDKSVHVLTGEYQGRPFNGPNDVWQSPLDRSFYFTDPFYRRSWWPEGLSTMNDHQADGQHVYRITSDGQMLHRVIGDFESRPNGIGGTSDGRVLYVADRGAGKTYAFKINEDGGLSHKRVFADEDSDGLTVDTLGNVYLTNRQCVSIFTSNGLKIGEIQLPEPTTNVVFAGADRKTLFVTARHSVYLVSLDLELFDQDHDG